MPEIEGKMKEKDVEKPERLNKRTKSFLNKVVIRKLPPYLTEESFIEIVSPLPDYFDLYFVPADWTLGAEATSRAYIEFKKEDDIFIFRDKFDGYVFVDSVRGSEYPAIVEYAAFQGLPKSRSRKKDKHHAGTIESEQHFLDFLEQLKKEEEADLKTEPKLEFSYQIKDDKKVTITPLIEFLAAKNREKRDAKRKKSDDKRKQLQDDKQKKKILIAKNIPESIKETKEEVLYDDGIMVRTVPSRSGRNDRKKDSKSDNRSEAKPKTEDNSDKNLERRKFNKEKEEKRKAERDAKKAAEREQRMSQKTKDQEQKVEQKKTSGESEKPKAEAKSEKPKAESKSEKYEKYEKSEPKPTNRDKQSGRDGPAKSETKRYSALRKARQEKNSEGKEAAPETQPEEGEEKNSEKGQSAQKSSNEKRQHEAKSDVLSPEQAEADAAKKEAQKEARLKRAQEYKERRQIRNRDRPSMQIYQPKRRNENCVGSENMKSSDENSEASRKKSDSDLKKSDTERKTEKRERRADRRSSRKNSRDEVRRKKTSRSEDDVEKPAVEIEVGAGDGGKPSSLVEKLGSLALKASKPKTFEINRENVNVKPKKVDDAEVTEAVDAVE